MEEHTLQAAGEQEIKATRRHQINTNLSRTVSLRGLRTTDTDLGHLVIIKQFLAGRVRATDSNLGTRYLEITINTCKVGKCRHNKSGPFNSRPPFNALFD
eukprot:1161975-Pelagomonas_calceolata.AAC.7